MAKRKIESFVSQVGRSKEIRNELRFGPRPREMVETETRTRDACPVSAVKKATPSAEQWAKNAKSGNEKSPKESKR